MYLFATLRGSRGRRAGAAFTTLIVANLGLILTNRSWTRTALATLRSPTRRSGGWSAGPAFFLGLVLYVPFLRDLFRLRRCTPTTWASASRPASPACSGSTWRKFLRRWRAEGRMSKPFGLLLLTGGLIGAVCLTVCSHLAGLLQLMVAGLVAFGCLAIWLTPALLRDALPDTLEGGR